MNHTWNSRGFSRAARLGMDLGAKMEAILEANVGTDY